MLLDVLDVFEMFLRIKADMLNESGGVIDDLIVYFLTESWFRVVVNAGTRDKDLACTRFVDGW